MDMIKSALENIASSYDNPALDTTVIISVLFMVLLLSMYEFAIYKLVSHRALYNRSFHVCIAVLPFFLSTLILCLQSNILITLGTIGALAILRFRNAVNDSVDMLYLLWSVHIGVICGCQLYEVAVLTALVVTVVLLVVEHVTIGKKSFILILYCLPEQEEELLKKVREHTKNTGSKAEVMWAVVWNWKSICI